MKCPKCNGVVHTHDGVCVDDNEIYRAKKCNSCGHIFFTVEYEVEVNRKFIQEWNKHKKLKKKEPKCAYHETLTLYTNEWPAKDFSFAHTKQQQIQICTKGMSHHTCKCGGDRSKCTHISVKLMKEDR